MTHEESPKPAEKDTSDINENEPISIGSIHLEEQ